jgi:transposase
MIPSGVEIFVALTPIDLRWGFDRLAGLAEEHIVRSARSGALFVFFGKRKHALRILFYDGSGMGLFYKRLDHPRATFRIPQASADATSVELSERELDDLLDGIALDVGPEHHPHVASACALHCNGGASRRADVAARQPRVPRDAVRGWPQGHRWSALVRSRFGEDPLSGTLFVFFSKRADRVRVFHWDRDGYGLTMKRLEHGRYKQPWHSEQGHVVS